MVDYASYIRNRITELRIQKDVSEYRMNLDLGQNRNYIQGITSGKALPSMAQFLNICEYFGITPFPTQKECRGKVQQFPLIDNLQHSML